MEVKNNQLKKKGCGVREEEGYYRVCFSEIMNLVELFDFTHTINGKCLQVV